MQVDCSSFEACLCQHQTCEPALFSTSLFCSSPFDKTHKTHHSKAKV